MNVALGKLAEWVKDQVKHGDYENRSELVREAVRRMKESQPVEPQALQLLVDEAENSGFKRFNPKDWNDLRRLAKSGINK